MANQIPTKAIAVTPSDTDYIPAGTLYVGTEGDLNVLLVHNDNTDTPSEGLVFKGVFGIFPYAVKKVFDTSTTADDIVLTY